LIVDKRLAIIKDVLCSESFLNAFCILFSVSISSTLVASSKIIIEGSFKNILAIDIRCFCPPDNFVPLSPTSVSSLNGNSLIKFSSWSCRIASYICVSSASICLYIQYCLLMCQKIRIHLAEPHLFLNAEMLKCFDRQIKYLLHLLRKIEVIMN